MDEKKNYIICLVFYAVLAFGLAGCGTHPAVISDEPFIRAEIELDEVIRLHDRVRDFNIELTEGIGRASYYAREAGGSIAGAIGALVVALDLLDRIEAEFYRVESELQRLVSGVSAGNGSAGTSSTNSARIYNPLLDPDGFQD